MKIFESLFHHTLYMVICSSFQWSAELKFLVLQVPIFIRIPDNFGATFISFWLNRLDSESQPQRYLCILVNWEFDEHSS